MKRSNVISVVMFLLITSSLTMNAQSERFKALFLYNFIKNIEWPQNSSQSEVVIGILGNNAIKSELETITSNQKSGNQAIRVKVFTSVEEVTNCHIIYVSPNKSNQIAQLSSKVNRQSTLIVSDSRSGISQGASINFIVNDEKLKYEISKHYIEQQGMKVSANLLKMGIEI